MGDLISRSAYKEKLKKELAVLAKELHEAVECEDDDLILAIKNQQSAYDLALMFLDNEPTAYDPEAVVAGIIAIHNKTCTEEIDCKGWNCDECFEMRVREVVRNGGKE